MLSKAYAIRNLIELNNIKADDSIFTWKTLILFCVINNEYFNWCLA